MRVIYHNWSATKQRPHPQSVAEISHHSVLSGDRIRHVRHRLGLATRTQISVCKLPFPSAVSLFRAKTVQQRPLLPREVETWLPLIPVSIGNIIAPAVLDVNPSPGTSLWIG